MTLGSGIFASTVLLVVCLGFWQITSHKKWKLVGKITAGLLAGTFVIGAIIYVWNEISNRPPPPSVVTALLGAKLGSSPTEIKLALGKPDAESEPTTEGNQTRIDLTYSSPSVIVTLYGKDRYSTKAEIICSRGYEAKLFGLSNADKEEELIERLGNPDSTSISRDGLNKIVSYSKWKASFTISKSSIVETCVHTFPVLSFTDELLSPEAQRAADIKAAEAKKAAAQAAVAAALQIQQQAQRQNQGTPTQSVSNSLADIGDKSDPCAPGLTRAERLKRLAAVGSVRQTGTDQFEAGSRTVMFGYNGGLIYCN